MQPGVNEFGNDFSDFDDPDSGWNGVRVDPAESLNNLLIIWATGYVEHSPTVHTRPDRPSDAIVVDAVNLDRLDETGQPVIGKGNWWRQGKLISQMRPSIGGKPLLGYLTLGVPKPGMKPPYEFVSLSQDPQAVARARAWRAANPTFQPSPPYRPRGGQQQPQQPPQQPYPNPAPYQQPPQQGYAPQGYQQPVHQYQQPQQGYRPAQNADDSRQESQRRTVLDSLRQQHQGNPYTNGTDPAASEPPF